jgi:hypothetical protein
MAVSRISAWKHAEAWRYQRRAMAQRYLDETSTVSNAFATAWADQNKGIAKLAAQAALKRVQTATKAKLAQTTAEIDKVQAQQTQLQKLV